MAMSDDELRKACDDVLTNWDLQVGDSVSIAARLLELLPPADDGERITGSWLYSLSGDGFQHMGWGVRFGCNEFEWHSEEVGGPSTLVPAYLGKGAKEMTVRGDVRRLCAALGIHLTESDHAT